MILLMFFFTISTSSTPDKRYYVYVLSKKYKLYCTNLQHNMELTEVTNRISNEIGIHQFM